ncbi:MAG: diguanylate cyclase [Sphingomonas sp. SCN 67-18]|uniref:putative bifunctional diguanylate cyclase/phosphodiesterase n=1 Tax=uncultured Sphingomonas sp. TaxID=158754 RepID=UPI000868FA9D|nr:EAL domain-containing protein [Sphingomonas sp. SCN 67-18]ODU21325.1 MAG: diguanylate cyclase [Sphingomonas sp. SCN 67-18]
MTKPAPESPAGETIDWRTLLGLSEPQNADWSQVRAAQIEKVQQFMMTRFIAEVMGAILIVILLGGFAPTPLLAGWFGVAMLSAIGLVLSRMRARDWRAGTASRRELHRETLQSMWSGVVWGAPPILFAGVGGLEQQLALWTTSVSLMAGAALLLSAIPLGTVGFLALVGAGVSAMMFKLHMPLLGVAGITLTFMLINNCIASARSFLLHKAASLALVEKGEVVSLLLREFEEGDADWLWQIDAAKSLTHVSKRLAYSLGEDALALEGRPFLQMLAGDSWESGNFSAPLRELAEKLKHRESFSDLILPVTVKGETRWWELSASPRLDERGAFLGFRGVGSDVTAERHSADKINRMARFDTLTGLPNRLQVTEALGQAMADAERWRGRCAFMMIDLDRFKAVNDTLGHPIGDRLLGRVSERLRQVMTENEMCGRLGGDEFAVVVRDASDGVRLEKLARTIIEELSRPYEVDQHTLYIGASVGTAIGPRDGRSVEMLIRSADLALYRSKDAGGGAYHAYEPQLHVHAEERRVLEIALRKALEKGELHIHYQPVVSADDAVIEGFEALLRWTHPELGQVSPAKFIPVAEEARLIAPIGEWVLRNACQEAAGWPSTVRIAVNVSAEQLHDPNFVTSVVSALAHSGLAPHRLELEVTESVFMREGSSAVSVLSQILDLGVRLALDDFGTGYSSLGYLSRTKFSTIKIDRSFVQGAARNAPESLAIIRAVVAMADSLKMTTTAEGVETEEEYAMIRRLGCRKVQGFLFGRPMPSQEARALFPNATRTAA